MKYEDKKKLIKAMIGDLTDAQKDDMYQSLEEQNSYAMDGYQQLNSTQEVVELIEKMRYHSRELEFAIQTLLAHHGQHLYMQDMQSDFFESFK